MSSNKEIELKRIFEEFDNPVTSEEYAADIPEIIRKAAVLVLLRWCDSDCCWKVLLTIRSQNVSTHQGEVAFPGGMRDKADYSPVDTALREAYEEVGLPASYVHIIGTGLPFRTRYSYALYPIIGLLDSNVNYEPFPNEEVSTCFWLPLDRFLSKKGHAIREFTVSGATISTNVFEDSVAGYDEPVITWGITSFIAIMIAMIVHERKPEYAFPTSGTLPHSGSLPFDDISWSQIIHAIMSQAMVATPTTSLTRTSKSIEADIALYDFNVVVVGAMALCVLWLADYDVMTYIFMWINLVDSGAPLYAAVLRMCQSCQVKSQ